MRLLPESSLHKRRDSGFERAVGERVERNQKEEKRTDPAPEQATIATVTQENQSGNCEERDDPEQICERSGDIRRQSFGDIRRLLLHAQPERSVLASQQVIEESRQRRLVAPAHERDATGC